MDPTDREKPDAFDDGDTLPTADYSEAAVGPGAQIGTATADASQDLADTIAESYAHLNSGLIPFGYASPRYLKLQNKACPAAVQAG